MLPNTFQALMLSGQVGWARYDVGYIWDIKARDSNDFISMSRQAGGPGNDEGLPFGAVELTPIKDLVPVRRELQRGERLQHRVLQGRVPHKVTEDLTLQFGLQYTDQRTWGTRGGSFNTWNVGWRRTSPLEGTDPGSGHALQMGTKPTSATTLARGRAISR